MQELYEKIIDMKELNKRVRILKVLPVESLNTLKVEILPK